MYIDKIFSEVDTDERIYTVLMDDEDYALYSAFCEQREFGFWSGLGKAVGATREAFGKVGNAISHSDVVRKAKIAAAGHGGVIDNAAKARRQAVVNNIKGKATSAVNAARQKGSEVAQQVKAAANKASDRTLQALERAGGKIEGGINRGINTVEGGINRGINRVSTTATNAANALRNSTANGLERMAGRIRVPQ